MEITCRVYKPRRARESPLYRLVEQHLEELLRVWPARVPQWDPEPLPCRCLVQARARIRRRDLERARVFRGDHEELVAASFSQIASTLFSWMFVPLTTSVRSLK